MYQQSLFMFLVSISFELELVNRNFEALNFQKSLIQFQNFNSFQLHILINHLIKIMNVYNLDLLNLSYVEFELALDQI